MALTKEERLKILDELWETLRPLLAQADTDMTSQLGAILEDITKPGDEWRSRRPTGQKFLVIRWAQAGMSLDFEIPPERKATPQSGG